MRSYHHKGGDSIKSLRYRGDPYWTTAKFSSRCRNCGKQISKGDNIFYYPKGKSVYCDSEGCGGQESRSFEAAVFDESVYHM